MSENFRGDFLTYTVYRQSCVLAQCYFVLPISAVFWSENDYLRWWNRSSASLQNTFRCTWRAVSPSSVRLAVNAFTGLHNLPTSVPRCPCDSLATRGAIIQILTGAERSLLEYCPRPKAEENIYFPADGKQFPVMTGDASYYLFCYTSNNAMQL